VIALLGGVGAGGGGFAHDDAFNEGPFHDWVGSDTADWLTAVRKQSFYVLLGFIALHVAAMLVHVVIKRQDLLRAMISGWMRLPAAVRVLNEKLRFAGPLAFLLAAGIAAGVAWWVASMVSTL